MSDSAATERPAEKKDRSHYLYMAVIAAVIAGIAVGILAPEVGKALKPLGTGFVSLIKMMISPVIFCTIVLGIGSIRQAAKVGKVGGLALLYFIAAWAIVTGVLAIYIAIHLRKELTGEWVLALAGVLSAIFGVMLIACPGAGALAVVFLIAGYAIAFGILMLMLAFKLKSLPARVAGA